jgi:hypothetical protein
MKALIEIPQRRHGMSNDTKIDIENFVVVYCKKFKNQRDELKEKLLNEMTLLKKSENAFNDFAAVLGQKSKDATDWLNMLNQMANEYVGSEYSKDLVFFETSAFLSLFEIGYLTYVDLICLLLVKNGHDLYNRGYCKNFDNVGLVGTNAKFAFLEEHGFSVIIRENDRKLRNTIAHLNFTIMDRNNILTKDGNVNMIYRVKDLCGFIVILNFETAKIMQSFV